MNPLSKLHLSAGKKIDCVAIGGSAGAIEALNRLLPKLKKELSVPVVCVLHMAPDSSNLLAPMYAEKCQVAVKESESTEALVPGTVYFCPADYHLSFERNHSFALSTEPPVNFSRPSIDLFFESAALAYGENVLGILLSGANSDGAKGLLKIRQAGGYCIAQDPAEAQYPTMPQSSMDLSAPHAILSVEQMADVINSLKPNSLEEGSSNV